MLNRQDYEARYRIFDKFALQDQRNYYQNKTEMFRASRGQVNFIRAMMGLLTGLATAIAMYLASRAYGGDCAAEAAEAVQAAAGCIGLRAATGVLAGLSIIFPAVAGFFGALQSLYQWDRFVQIYKDALESLEAADAQLTTRTSSIPDEKFMAAYLAYTEGTLEVMESETSQWGQTVKTPAQIEAFVQRQVDKAKTMHRGVTGEGGKQFENPDSSFG